MSMSTLRSSRRPRRHGVLVEPADRRVLERAGWRTTLDYRENHVRARDGRLLEVVPTWTAEAERFDGDLVVASAAAATVEEAWARLRDDVEAHRATTTPRSACCARSRILRDGPAPVRWRRDRSERDLPGAGHDDRRAAPAGLGRAGPGPGRASATP